MGFPIFDSRAGLDFVSVMSFLKALMDNLSLARALPEFFCFGPHLATSQQGVALALMLPEIVSRKR